VADDDPSRIPSAEELTASLSGRVRQVLQAAELAAAEVRARADAAAEERAHEIRHAAEQDADRLRRRAEREASDYLEDARRRVDAFADGRARRISAAVDLLLVHAEALAERTGRVARLQHGIEDVIDALTAAAAAVAAEAHRNPIILPHDRQPAELTRLAPRPHAVPDPGAEPAPLAAAPDLPEQAAPLGAPAPGAPAKPVAVAPVAPDEPEDAARAHVREVADALPRRPGTRPRVPTVVIVPPFIPPDDVA
jgi:hypothetical protein